jgi:hypothetical protein
MLFTDTKRFILLASGEQNFLWVSEKNRMSVALGSFLYWPCKKYDSKE